MLEQALHTCTKPKVSYMEKSGNLTASLLFYLQEKKKRSAEELVEIQELIKTTGERMEEVSTKVVDLTRSVLGISVLAHLPCTEANQSKTDIFEQIVLNFGYIYC